MPLFECRLNACRSRAGTTTRCRRSQVTTNRHLCQQLCEARTQESTVPELGLTAALSAFFPWIEPSDPRARACIAKVCVIRKWIRGTRPDTCFGTLDFSLASRLSPSELYVV